MPNKLLLIGNGPSALAKEMGELIDNYDGTVLRFNAYVTKGFESYIGSRTDFWWTGLQFDPEIAKHKHKSRFIAEPPGDKPLNNVDQILNAEIVSFSWSKQTAKLMDCEYPTSGAIAVLYFLDKGYEIELWGFDFMQTERQHHYASPKDDVLRGDRHDGEKELSYFTRLLDSGQIRYFGQERKPIVVWTCDVEGWAYHNRFLRLSKNLPDYDHRLYLFGGGDLSRIERVRLLRSADIIVCQGVKALRVARMKGLDPTASNYEDAKRGRFENIVGRLDSMRVDHNGEYYDIWTGERIEN